MKLYMSFILLGSMLLGYNTHAQQNLTVDNAIKVVWKMNHNDISKLHNAVFEKPSSSLLDNLTTKIEQIYQSLKNNIWDKPLRIQILEMLLSESISIQQKEHIRQAIKESYKEFEIRLSGADIFMSIFLFPIGLLIVAKKMATEEAKHIKATELKRAAIELNI